MASPPSPMKSGDSNVPVGRVVNSNRYVLPDGQELNHEQFLMSIFFPFVKHVDPVKSKLIDKLKEKNVINETEYAQIRNTRSPVKQANLLWTFLYNAKEGMFWTKCVPVLESQCPDIVSKAAASPKSESPENVCACHQMQHKLHLSYICCFLLLAKDTVSEALYSRLFEDVEAGTKWAAIFQYFRENYNSNVKLQKSLDIWLKLYLNPDESQNVRQKLIRSNFTCTSDCTEHRAAEVKKGPQRSWWGFCLRGCVRDTSAEESEVETIVHTTGTDSVHLSIVPELSTTQRDDEHVLHSSHPELNTTQRAVEPVPPTSPAKEQKPTSAQRKAASLSPSSPAKEQERSAMQREAISVSPSSPAKEQERSAMQREAISVSPSSPAKEQERSAMQREAISVSPSSPAKEQEHSAMQREAVSVSLTSPAKEQEHNSTQREAVSVSPTSRAPQ